MIDYLIEEYCPEMKAPYWIKAIVAIIKSGVHFYGNNPWDFAYLITSLISLGVAIAVLAIAILRPQ